MKIGIIGAGAMGSVYAGLMADSGHDVWMFDNWAEHVAAINANGLKVEGASGDRVARPHATSNAADAGVVELAAVPGHRGGPRRAGGDVAGAPGGRFRAGE